MITTPESGLLSILVRSRDRARLRRGLIGLGCMFGAGCGGTEQIELSPPESVRFIGAVTVDPERDVVLASTPLLPRGEVLELDASEDALTWILGYDDVSLALLRERARANGQALEELARSSPLSISSGCEEELPVAAWAAQSLGGQAASDVPPETAPRFRATWVATLCAGLPEASPSHSPLARSWSIESEWAHCPQTSLSMTGCSVRFDLAACGSSRTTPLEFAANPDGRACLKEQSSCSDESAIGDRAESTLLQFGCKDLGEASHRYRVHANEWEDGDVFADLEWVRIIERDIPEATEDELSRTIQFTGHVTSIATLGPEVLFTTHPESLAGYRCETMDATRLVFVDARSLQLVRTASAAPCLTKVVADGEGGFFGLSRPQPGRFMVGRYDGLGRLLEERSVLVISDEDLHFEHWASAFIEVPSGLLAVVTTGYLTESQGARPPTSQTKMVWLSRELQVTSVTSPPLPTEVAFVGNVTTAETPSGPRLIYTEDYADLVAFGDLEGRSIDGFSTLGRRFGAAYRVATVAALSPVSFALSVVGSDVTIAEARVTSDGGIEIGRRAVFHEFPADLSSVVRLPSGGVFTTAVVRDVASSELVWTRFDPETWRFRPGSLRLIAPDGTQPGPSNGSSIDPSGRVWLTFSLSHWSVRLSPRD